MLTIVNGAPMTQSLNQQSQEKSSAETKQICISYDTSQVLPFWWDYLILIACINAISGPSMHIHYQTNFACKHISQAHRIKQIIEDYITHQKQKNTLWNILPQFLETCLSWTLVFTYFKCLHLSHSSILEFGRQHKIKQLPQELPDLWMPLITTERAKTLMPKWIKWSWIETQKSCWPAKLWGAFYSFWCESQPFRWINLI